jgi:3-methyladenine DNA glycosylase AlkD
MDINKLHKNIVDYCRKNINASIIKKYSRYFNEGYDAYGLSQEKMDEITKKILNSKDMDLKKALELSTLLVKSGKYEETMLAVRFVKHFSKDFNLSTFKEIEGWFSIGINNWAHTDVICGSLMAEFIEQKIITLNSLIQWRTALNKYQRRAVPVSMLNYLKKRKDRFETMFDFIESLMTDNERVVQQGLGWFLREAWKNKKKETEKFLIKWKDKAPRLIFQYATEKMSPAEKVKFKKGKVKS